MKYLVWQRQYKEGFCALGALENVPKDHQIRKGISRAEGFPADACYEMRADFPKDVEVPDNVYTMIHHVVSAKLRDVLLPALGTSRVEMLPVKIKNHKKRFVAGEFFVMNPLDIIDCIDTDASQAELNLIDPTTIMTVERLVLRNIPEGIALLRPSMWKALVLVREDVAHKLEKAGLTGLFFEDSDEFTG